MAKSLRLSHEEKTVARVDAEVWAEDIKHVLAVDIGQARELLSGVLDEPFKLRGRDVVVAMERNAQLITILRGENLWEIWGVDAKVKKEPEEKKAPPERSGGYEPPRVRFECPNCENQWDAWVNDDGTLQDPRDKRCCGMDSVLVDDED